MGKVVLPIIVIPMEKYPSTKWATRSSKYSPPSSSPISYCTLSSAQMIVFALGDVQGKEWTI
jgi:hypothetical protein